MSVHQPVNVLLVDDTPGKLLSYEAILHDLGENLIKVTSAREALTELLRTDVAVVLTDVCMPHMDGFEFASLLRRHPRCERTAIIFISAVHLSDVDYVRAYDSGAVDYVTIPVVPEILRAKVKIFAELYRKTYELERLNVELERRVAERAREVEASSARLKESEERLRLASQAAGFGTYDYDLSENRLHWSSHLTSFADIGMAEPSCLDDLLGVVHEDDRDALRRCMRDLSAAADGRHEIEFRVFGREGDIRWVLDRGQSFHGGEEDGRPKRPRVRGTMLDITERKRAETHQQLLMAELDHRVKNTLANVLAIANLSSKQTCSVSSFVRALQGRIQSMSTAHDLLRCDNWEGADFRRLADATLRPFQTAEGNIRVSGGPVRLKPKAAQSVALVLHELATNALKHGALSRPQGTVELSWERLSAHELDRLRITWRESGGPVVVSPAEEGFGLTALRAAAYEADAEAEISFTPDGLCYTLTGPLLARESDARTKVAGEDARASMAFDGARSRISRILVVEDEPLVALQLQTLLEDEGYEVLGPATTLAEGLHLAQNSEFHLALLDINLGDQTSAPIAVHLFSRNIPVVFSTGYTDTVILPDEFRSVPRLQKPFTLEEIRRIISQGVSPMAPSPPAHIEGDGAASTCASRTQRQRLEFPSR